MKEQPTHPKVIRAALFDMDGTLVDNSEVHVRAFGIFCDRYGVQDWQEKLSRCFGMGSDDIMQQLLPESIIRKRGLKALGEEKEEIYRTIYAPEIRPVEGLIELLELLRRNKIRCAVGSSGCRENVRFVLEKCGISTYFEAIVSGDMVSRCKPDPEIYLNAAKKLGVKIEECIIFEDARAGFEAARRADAGRIAAIATTLSRQTIIDEGLADIVVERFDEIERIEQLL